MVQAVLQLLASRNANGKWHKEANIPGAVVLALKQMLSLNTPLKRTAIGFLQIMIVSKVAARLASKSTAVLPLKRSLSPLSK